MKEEKSKEMSLENREQVIEKLGWEDNLLFYFIGVEFSGWVQEGLVKGLAGIKSGRGEMG